MSRFEAPPPTQRPQLLFVTHAGGGGVRRHIDELAASLSDAADVVVLEPDAGQTLRLRANEESLWFDADSEWEAMVSLLATIGIDRVHFHHVHGLPEAVLDLPRLLGCAHDVTLHDFYPACPAYHFTDGAGRFCGAQAGCQHCDEAHAPQWFAGIGEWRAKFSTLLASASRVIAPSNAAAELLRRFFPAVVPHVWPHAEPEPPAVQPTARILVPGAISEIKGLALLEACVNDAATRELPLHFRVVGFIGRALANAPRSHFSITGEFAEGNLASLLALERGDVIFFPSQCPETYSYTLSNAIASGIPIVATDLGALPERLAGRPATRVIPWNSTAREFNEALLHAARPRSQSLSPAAFASVREYRDRYLEGIQRAAPRIPSPPTIDPAWRSPPSPTRKSWSFKALLVDAIDCGRASSVAELREAMAAADEARDWNQLARVELDHLNTELRLARDARDAEKAQVAAKEARIREQAQLLAETRNRMTAAESELYVIHGSRSWKLTAPLRRAMRLLERLRRPGKPR